MKKIWSAKVQVCTFKIEVKYNYFFNETQVIFINWAQVLPMLHEVSSNSLTYVSLQLLSAEEWGLLKYFFKKTFIIYLKYHEKSWQLIKRLKDK